MSGEIQAFFAAQLVDRRERPREDLITRVSLAEAEHDDGTRVPFTERERIGALFVIMLGGVDTTWSTIGSSLFHLATHPDDLAALVSDRSLVPSAVEEFLRFYAPATVARVVRHDDEVGGCPVGGGERILMSFPSANRDPAYFDRPDEVVLDRPNNRHLAFGTGVHRCIGSNLARMELEVALRCWLARIPRFELAVDPSEIEWTTGPIRGPRSVPLRVLP